VSVSVSVSVSLPTYPYLHLSLSPAITRPLPLSRLHTDMWVRSLYVQPQ